MRLVVAIVLAVTVLLGGTVVAPARGASSGTEQFGALEFPRDEHLHPDGRDYWWGAADLVTDKGNRYSISFFTFRPFDEAFAAFARRVAQTLAERHQARSDWAVLKGHPLRAVAAVR